MFHKGASIPGDHPILEGDGETARNAKFADADDIVRKKAALEAVVRAWCELQDA